MVFRIFCSDTKKSEVISYIFEESRDLLKYHIKRIFCKGERQIGSLNYAV